MASKVVVAEYSAEGGPEKPFMAPDGHEAGPTDAGEYVIAYCAEHRSRRYPQWSSIPWGSPLKQDGDRLLVLLDGRWQDVFKLTGASPDAVESYHQQLYGIEKIPDKWVFNDFGHLTCYMFKDLNRNSRLDRATEKIHGEFFHTTPPDEAATSLHTPVRLGRTGVFISSRWSWTKWFGGSSCAKALMSSCTATTSRSFGIPRVPAPRPMNFIFIPGCTSF